VNETRLLAQHAVGIRVEALEGEVVDKTKQCILDALGNAVRAQHDADSSSAIAASIGELASGAQGVASVAGHTELFPSHYAAFLNATYAHSLEFDDTHARGSIHPGCVVIPAALAVAEEVGADGRTLLAAVVAGYEVACRISMALIPTVHLNRGFHPTATCGTFGAAAAAAVVWRLSAETLDSALGLCGSMAAGSMQFFDNGSWNKRVHCGTAAHNGLVAARMARRGVIGSTQAIEGRSGFLKAYSDGAIAERVTEDLGKVWAVAETALKPYPTCRSTHSPMDSIIKLMKAEQIQPDSIESMTIGISVKGLDLVGEPADRKRLPQNEVDAQFSMHWTAAVAALKGRMIWSDYALLHDPQVLDLARRTEVVVDPQAEALWPGHFASSVVIRAAGREHRLFVEDATGEPALPLSWPEVEAKFRGLVEEKLAPIQQTKVIDLIRRLEQVEDVRMIGTLLRGN